MRSVIVPLHNESAWLESGAEALLSDLADLRGPSEMLLVENGSVDGTLSLSRALAARWPGVVRVVSIPEPDYGRAVREGMIAAHGDRCLVIDADNWQAGFLEEAESRLARGADIVIGDKSWELDERPDLRRLATRLNRGLVGTLFPILNGADVHGTLLCRGTVLPQLLRRCVTGRDVFKVELLVMALRNGCRLETVPLPTRENRSARSGLSGRSLRYLTDLLRFWCQGSTY